MSNKQIVSSRALGVLVAVALVGAAITLFGLHLVFRSEMPLPLGIAVVSLGAMELFCAHFARQRLRTAWAFLCSMNGTCVLITLFGAPKIRDSAEIAMGPALVPCFVFSVVVALLVVFADDILA